MAVPLLPNESTTAGAIARLLAAETTEYVELLVIWASISLALGAGVPGAGLGAPRPRRGRNL